MNAGLILFLIFYSLPGNRGTGVHLLECGLSGGRGVRGPSGLLHGYRPKDLWRAAVQLYHGHCIFCTGWQSYDEGGDFQADCRFCGLPGGQRERRYEPGAGTGLCILCCPYLDQPLQRLIAIGTMLYGDMIKKGYPGPRTAGLLVVSGGLGPIIPPSIIMVIYCTLTGASVGNMFKQGMMIGIVIMLVLMVEGTVVCP